KGDIVTGQEQGKTGATFIQASKDNPVLGRIAFWTDDESCKVNINTAAGDEWTPQSTSYGAPAGSYWDIPRTFSLFDRQALANYQPAQGEYQRYPGHPATTYLSAVFPQLTSDQIGKIASRVQRGGSLGGTTLASGKITGDTDRLYASIDELVFDPNRGDQPIDEQRLEHGRFFLTAHSRAPEVNLFNKPRIAIWPINRTDSTATRSPYDRLIAFCSSIKGQPYFFDRMNAYSATDDYAGRNVTLYSYLQNLTSQAVPGFGGKFSDKYGTPDRDQFLTEILDYIRSTNLFDDTIEPTPYSYPTRGAQFTRRRTSQTGVDPGHGQVTPLRIGTTQGFGRFYTISEAALHFICTGDAAVADSNQTTGANANRTLQAALTTNQRRMETMLLLEFFSPSQGWTGIVPDMQVHIKGLDKLTVNGTGLGFPADATMQMTLSGTSTYHGRAWGGSSGFRFQLNGRKLPTRGFMPADGGWSASNNYPFVGIPITVTVPTNGTPTMTFASGGSSDFLTVEIYSGATAAQNAQNLVQTLKIKFPNGTFPIPTLVQSGTAEQVVTPPSTPASSATSPQNWWSFSAAGAINGQTGRIAHVNRAPGTNGKPEEGAFIRAEDVVRSVIPTHGDYRLVAGKQTIPTTVFTKQRYYDDTSNKMAHALTEAVGMAYMQGPDTGGKLVLNATYDSAHVPDIPADLQTKDSNSQIRLNRGDWDTGVAYVMDGAYINKPDEGNNYRGATGGQIPYFDNNQAQEAGGPTFFSPNRQMPSAVMFGSLPTGIFADAGVGRSWRTLLFRPDASGASQGAHTGATSPKDHLLLDLFWMPVVEPYAISEPFSTAGKVNMNCQVAPFTYIKRTTALRALLKSERVIAIPKADASKYKGGSAGNYRFEINADETLKQFDQRFASGKNQPFKSASEICDLYLVPQGQSLTGMPDFWTNTYALTGDNLRERPYASLYPRLTTKSNIFSVHFYVQTLKQVNRNTSGSWQTWDEKKDVVTGEYRGTALIERYIDFNDDLPDFTQPGLDPAETLDKHCKLRVLQVRKFDPGQ
ncbi:MAG: Verru_Chthon cassette protein A, partial [Chthoniobacter sp.]